MLDFLLERYSGSVDYVLDMKVMEFFELYIKAMEKTADERLFQMYCAILPNYNQETYQTFAEFKNNSNKHEQVAISQGDKTDDENIEFANSIMKMELVEKK